MPRTLAQLLAPQTIQHAISQLDLPGTTLQRLFGWGLSGDNRLPISGRNFAYDVFNHTRRVAFGRGPGQAAGRIAPQGAGYVSGVFPRAAETIALLDEDLLNRRQLGGDPHQLDHAGERFLTKQEAYLAQRFANLIEFQTAALLRGSYSYQQEGDDLRHAFSGGATTIDFQLPAGNLGQLDMLGDGPLLDADWNDPTTDIPDHLHAINAALVRLTGFGLAHVVLTGVGWRQVITNEHVQTLGGAGATPWASLQRGGGGEFSAVLRALPWIEFHVIDYGLEVWDGAEESFAKLIDDDHAAFFPEPSPRWCQLLVGSEIVTEGPGGPRAERFGFFPYAWPVHDPSGWELGAVYNGIPALYTPQAVAYGQISGGVYV